MKKYAIILFFLAYINSVNAQVNTVSFEELEESVLKSKSDSVYVVNFWATWCGPCVKELPEFVVAQDSLKDEKVKYLFVSLDFPGSEERVEAFFAKKNLEGKLLMLHESDANSWINKLDPEWQGNIPATWFVNPKEETQHFHIGTIETKQLIEKVNKIR